jgi:hypothetical protein
MERWIIINYFPHEPSHVYGVFDSEEEALIYAEVQGMSTGGNAYEIKSILDVNEE